MTLAARLAPHMSGTLIHPGDDTTEPFPVAPIPVFANTATMPKGMAEDMAEQAGLPHPDFALIYCEAWIELIKTVTGIDLNDPDLTPERQAEIRAAAALNEPKRNTVRQHFTECGQPAFRVMVRDFDTDHPRVPCATVQHECKGRQ